MKFKKIIAAALCALPVLTGAMAATAASISVINRLHDVVGGCGSDVPVCASTQAPAIGLIGLGHTATRFAFTTAGYTAALAANDILIIEQGGNATPQASALETFMNNGGRVIELGGSGAGLMNALFSASAVHRSVGSDLVPFNSTAAVLGTSFETSPNLIRGLSSHHEISSGTPAGAEIFYTGATGDAVIRKTVGSGDYFYIGWDFCCGGTEALRNDWYAVLDAAITYGVTPPPATVPLPAGMPLALGALAVTGLVTRKKTRATGISAKG